MAISRRTGREYTSRRENGYRNTNKRPKRYKYPKGYDRLGQPTICGVIDEATGKECRESNFEHHARCEYHQAVHEQELVRKGVLRRSTFDKDVLDNPPAGKKTSTDVEQVPSAEARKPKHLRTNAPSVEVMPNELATTDRYWSAVPPGMESIPLDWEGL